ncbi:MAG: indolepyruvate oxidoreductase subunit beta [Bilophila sp.]
MNTLRISIVGVGGQGNVLASKMIGEAALSEGVPVLMSETHGMAQRGGVVESTVVLGGGHSPVISDHCADILLAFEPMEAVRALVKAHAGTLVITNTAPVVPFIPGGAAAYPPVDELLACLQRKAARVVAFDARKEALEAGNPLGLNMVMLGALYGAGDMPVSRESQMEAIRRSGKAAFAEGNLRCFERGFLAASQEAERR